MPTTKRKRRHARDDKLTLPQLMALACGDCNNIFGSDEARRRAWIEHRAELKELMRGEICWAEVMFDLGGFLESEGWRMSAALERLGMSKKVSEPPTF